VVSISLPLILQPSLFVNNTSLLLTGPATAKHADVGGSSILNSSKKVRTTSWNVENSSF
jgi:hypothetical protein